MEKNLEDAIYMVVSNVVRYFPDLVDNLIPDLIELADNMTKENVNVCWLEGQDCQSY